MERDFLRALVEVPVQYLVGAWGQVPQVLLRILQTPNDVMDAVRHHGRHSRVTAEYLSPDASRPLQKRISTQTV